MVKDFDISDQTWNDASDDFSGSGSHGDDGQIALQLIQAQREYLEGNKRVSYAEFEKLVSAGHNHVYRANDTDEWLSKLIDGNWRGGTGARAHGAGVYTSTNLDYVVNGYGGWGNGHFIEMAFDQQGSKIASSRELYDLTQRLQATVDNDRSLTSAERRLLQSFINGGQWGSADQGALAAFLGFDVVEGNPHHPRGSAYDFNILNKNKVTFHKKAKAHAGTVRHGVTLDKQSISTAGYGNGVRNPALADALDAKDTEEEAVVPEGAPAGGAPAGPV
jgi:hypothetical protein